MKTEIEHPRGNGCLRAIEYGLAVSVGGTTLALALLFYITRAVPAVYRMLRNK